MKRTTSILILMAMLAASVASCGGEATTTDTTAAAEGDTTPAVTDAAVTEPVYELPKADFGGRDVQFYIGDTRSKIHVTEETGDLVNDAIYRRNRKVEEQYNCNFKYTVTPCAASTWGTWYSTLEASIMANDNSVDIAIGYAYRFSALSVTSGLFQNLAALPQIDMSQPWWPGNVTEAAKIGSKLFMVQGNIDPLFYDRIYALIFNKKMADDLKLDFYKYVEDGKWTLDKLEEVAKLGTRDLDGNSTLDEKDQWGFVTGCDMSMDGFNSAFQLDFVEYDKDGMPKLLPLSEKVVDACTRMKEFTKKSQTAWHTLEADKKIIFEEGRALVMVHNLAGVQTMRDLENDFGIIPYPKWDEKQEQYGSFSAGVDNAGGYCIPITADGEKNAALLEAMAYYGYNDILPDYYEKVLKGKNTRDDESAAMLDLIFDNISFNFCQIYSYAFGDQKAPTMLMRMTIKNDTEIASTFEADKALYESTIAKLVDALK